jgi:hypothetical protein
MIGISPKNRARDGCVVGAAVGQVDHELAFGFPTSRVDWRACNLPEYPAENHRVCYRTTIDKCGNQYRVYLNRRNFASLNRKCNNESESLPKTEDSTIVFASPRYNCIKKRGNSYPYRHNEFCLYNVSISDCESGSVVIESPSDNQFRQQLQERTQSDDGLNGTCADYLQFYYDIGDSTVKTSHYCGTELSHPLEIEIPATQFMAVFWTDPGDNYLGFNLRARCVSTVASGQDPDEITP